MKIVMVANAVIKSVFIICVTAASIYFENPRVLWWLLLTLVLGYDYKESNR